MQSIALNIVSSIYNYVYEGISPQGRQNSYPGLSVLQEQGFQGPE